MNSADDSIRYLAGAAELADVAPCSQPGAESDPRADDSHSADLCSVVPLATAVLARAPAASGVDDPRDSAPAASSQHELQHRPAPLRQSAPPPSTRIGIALSFHTELDGTATTRAVSVAYGVGPPYICWSLSSAESAVTSTGGGNSFNGSKFASVS